MVATTFSGATPGTIVGCVRVVPIEARRRVCRSLRTAPSGTVRARLYSSTSRALKPSIPDLAQATFRFFWTSRRFWQGPCLRPPTSTPSAGQRAVVGLFAKWSDARPDVADGK